MTKDNIKTIMIALENLTKTEAVNLALNIHGRLVEDTPKDTGWAASNWVPQIGSRFTGLVGDNKNIDTSKQADGVIQVMKWELSRGPAYITNNVPYIQALNAGNSQQAPAMFVEKIVNSEVAKANRRRIK